MNNTTKRFLSIFVGLLALIGFGSSASFYFREPANAGFADYPTITALHVILGGVYMALAPFQFIPQVRKNWPNFHRRSGRLLVAVGVIVGFTATLITIIFPYSGWPERIIVTPFTLLFSIAIVIGFWHVRAKRIRLHQEWMLRAFSVGLAISTQRLLFLPPLIYIIRQTGNPTESQLTFLTIVSFSLALILHVLFAEFWIRRNRPKN
ncbi:MAG: DUF2306 domain-containing protein [Anaerolineae bacterium]